MKDYDEAARQLCFRFLANTSLWGGDAAVLVAAPDRLLTWREEDFDLSVDDAADAAAQRAYVRRLAVLSRLVDVIPVRSTIAPDGPRLSALLQRVLETGQPAQAPPLSEEEQLALKAARDLLYTIDPAGYPQPSPRHLLYKQYRDRYYSAEQALRSAGNDPAKIGALLAGDEYAGLADAVQQARQDWVNLGYKHEIELARNTEQTYAMRAPIESWMKWRQAFASATWRGVDGFDFFPAALTPSDAASSAWTPEQISASAAGSMLAALAGDKLKQLEATTPVEQELREVRFEYTFARVERYWHSNDASPLLSRIWRSGEFPAGSISDGASGAGACPAFVVGLILVRNLERHRLKSNSQLIRSIGIPSGELAMMNTTVGSGGYAGFASIASASGGPGSRVPAGLGARNWAPADLASLQTTGLTPVGEPDAQADDDLARMVRAMKKQETRQKLIDLFKPRTPAPVPKEVEVVRTTAPGQILLAGFVCKRVPRCPDPDPALVWG